jgi:glycosyltransferase involved in cell wall biosynthesis
MEVRSSLSNVTVCIPVGREVIWVSKILDQLVSENFSGQISLVTARKTIFEDLLCLSRTYQKVKLKIAISFSKKGHCSALRNLAIENVNTDWCWFLDDDIRLDSGFSTVLSSITNSFSDTFEVIQGCPYNCSNEHSWLARCERELYEIRVKRNLSEEGTIIRILDPRNLIIKTATIRSFKFNEQLHFGGDGLDLAERLREQGILTRYSAQLVVFHHHRDTWATLIKQKLRHGIGRVALDSQLSFLETGIIRYIHYVFHRHFMGPFRFFSSEKMSLQLKAYTLITTWIFCVGLMWGLLTRKYRTLR